MKQRPPFIINARTLAEEAGRYPESQEITSYGRPVGREAGLRKIGVWLERLPPGHRTSWPHAHSSEEEFVYVLEGEVDAWIDGHLHHLTAGDFVAFPAGTGIAHAFINNGDADVSMLVGGESQKTDDRLFYPLHPDRRGQMPEGRWWSDVPPQPRGPHDGKPRRRS